MRILVGKVMAVAMLCVASLSASATTINSGYWNIYYYGANPPSQGAAVEWAPGGLTPDDYTLGQVSQSGSRVVLKPNVHFCENALGQAQSDIDYWCYSSSTPDKGKWLTASSYEQTAFTAGGVEEVIPFTGCIASNTLSDHTVAAFVKVFSPSFELWYEEYDSSGTFNLPATLAGDADAIVQHGFAVSGPTVRPDEVDDYGVVVVDMGGACAAAPTPEYDPNAIPALPLGGLLGLIGLVGWLGLRRRI